VTDAEHEMAVAGEMTSGMATNEAMRSRYQNSGSVIHLRNDTRRHAEPPFRKISVIQFEYSLRAATCMVADELSTRPGPFILSRNSYPGIVPSRVYPMSAAGAELTQ
jgi:hypothetical protein